MHWKNKMTTIKKIPPILTVYSAKPLLLAIKKKKAEAKTVSISLDLGMSLEEVNINEGGAHIHGMLVTCTELQKIIKNNTSCFFCTPKGIQKIHFFDEDSSTYFKLVPSGARTPPTFEISGIRMHVTKSMDPMRDTKEKIKTIKPIKGNVLDCCMGLG